MENKVDVSVILPIKSSKTKDFEEYFNKAIQSIQNQITQVNELVIVSSNESSLVEYLENYDFGELNVKKIIWDKEPNYCSQLNFGVENASSKWISIFEFDDEYSTIWFKNVKKHIEAYSNVEMFLPVVVETDDKSAFVGFTNEAVFAANFSQEIGFLTNDTLQDYQNFQTAGSVIKKSVFES